MIDLTTEKAIALEEAARHIPPSRGGTKTHISTLLRWILNGCVAPDGSRVRLEGVRLGSRWVTSLAALQRFVERLTPTIEEAGEQPTDTRTPRQRQKAADRAAQELSRIGI